MTSGGGQGTTFGIPELDPDLQRWYKRAFWLLSIGYAIPIPFLVLDLCLFRKPEWFAPSGAIILFVVAVVQFKQLALLHNKHIRNAERARTNQQIQLLSGPYRRLECRSFVAGLLGTLIWAYGDKLIKLVTLATGGNQ
jgi:hypothetical protein